MIKVGDKVTLFSDIRFNGIVIEIMHVSDGSWFIGGTGGKKSVAKVQFSEEDIREIPTSQLMRIE
jgi:hypothetical protein